MEVETIAIGQELLWGSTVNTNAAFLSQEMSRLGYRVVRHTTLPDDPTLIQKGVQEAKGRVPIVLVTGGLGPTLDDLTRWAVEPLFKKGGEELRNRIGTAPGLLFLERGRGVVLLPGVPQEMKVMFLEEALPRLEEELPPEAPSSLQRVSFCLLKEREVDPSLRKLQGEYPRLRIGIFPSYGTLEVVLEGEGADEGAKKLISMFPTFHYGAPSLSEALLNAFVSRGKTLVLAESCTGGAAAAEIVRVAGASSYFLGSIVSYSNSWKERLLTVSRTTLMKEGAVSEPAVREMAAGLFAESEAHFVAAVSGIAGPGGGSPQKPVGTVYFAIGERGGKLDVGKIVAPADRTAVIRLSVNTLLGALWRRVVHQAWTFS